MCSALTPGAKSYAFSNLRAPSPARRAGRGDRLALEQLAREIIGAQAGAADIEQHEHAALGRGGAAVGRRSQNAGQDGGAAPVILAQRRHLRQVALERRQRALLEEWRPA